MPPEVATTKNVVVIPRENRAIIPPVADRDFWMAMRHSLLQQLAAIEKKLGIDRRCRHCGNNLSG